MSRVEWLTIVGEPDRWRSLGLTVTADGFVPLVGTALRIVTPDDDAAQATSRIVTPDGAATSGAPGAPAGPAARGAPARPAARRASREQAVAGDDQMFTRSPGGIVSWAISGGVVAAGDDTWLDVDGLPTEVVPGRRPEYAEHELGAVGIDHVVVLTSDLERTSSAIATATGCELKRVREVGAMRQGFHRIGGGGLIVEIVERPEVEADIASFWGLVINVEDLDAACELIGEDRISDPKDAVQPGRRIATVRADVGLGLPLALMTP